MELSRKIPVLIIAMAFLTALSACESKAPAPLQKDVEQALSDVGAENVIRIADRELPDYRKLSQQVSNFQLGTPPTALKTGKLWPLEITIASLDEKDVIADGDETYKKEPGKVTRIILFKGGLLFDYRSKKFRLTDTGGGNLSADNFFISASHFEELPDAR